MSDMNDGDADRVPVSEIARPRACGECHGIGGHRHGCVGRGRGVAEIATELANARVDEVVAKRAVVTATEALNAMRVKVGKLGAALAHAIDDAAKVR